MNAMCMFLCACGIPGRWRLRAQRRRRCARNLHLPANRAAV